MAKVQFIIKKLNKRYSSKGYRLKNSKTLSRRIARQARKDLVDNYTWESRANKIISKTIKYNQRHNK